jgi:hypothetical protein
MAADTVIVSQTYYMIVQEATNIDAVTGRRSLWEDITTFEQSDWITIKTLN